MRYLIAIGGNALESSKVLNSLSSQVINLHNQGNDIVLTHGNGPQVGKLALHEKKNLATLTAETQVQMGNEIEKSLQRASGKSKIKVSIVYTSVLVDRNDKEFSNPTKPIGKFYNKEEAEDWTEKGFQMKKLLDGYRRVVPSPAPKKIIELSQIKNQLDAKRIVIAGGGGGIAVVKKENMLMRVGAVIDKDLTSALLARSLKVHRLIILTHVDGVFLNYEKKSQKLLDKVNVRELQRYIRQDQFEPGSMLPKVHASINFVKDSKNMAIIGNLRDAGKVFDLKSGTIIVT